MNKLISLFFILVHLSLRERKYYMKMYKKPISKSDLKKYLEIKDLINENRKKYS
mgnify:CR=1 FL=1